MNEEERQRQMDFISNTLAHASAKIDSLAEMHKLTEQERRMSEQDRRMSEQERKADAVRLARVEEALVALSRLSQRSVERLDEHEEQISDVKKAIVILTRLANERQNGES
jgi:hypothetical protein